MSVSVCEGQNGQDNIIWMYSYCWFWSSQAGTHSGGLWGDVQWLASGSPPEPESTLKAPASLDGLGWLWWTWVLKRINLSLIFSLKHLWKPNFCENVCPCKPFYFWHSFWMTLYVAWDDPVKFIIDMRLTAGSKNFSVKNLFAELLVMVYTGGNVDIFSCPMTAQ